MAFMTFHSVGNVMTPTDFHSIIFQRGRRTNHQPEIGHRFTSAQETTWMPRVGEQVEVFSKSAQCAAAENWEQCVEKW